MNVDVIVNGRPWKVALEPAEQAGTFTVTIKGKSRLVDASWIDADTLSLIDGGAAREIRLHSRGDNGAVGVEFGGRVYEAVVLEAGTRERGRVHGCDSATCTGGVQQVRHARSRHPCRVASCACWSLSATASRRGRPVVVVEAMKMENELRTPRDGVVKEVAWRRALLWKQAPSL